MYDSFFATSSARRRLDPATVKEYENKVAGLDKLRNSKAWNALVDWTCEGCGEKNKLKRRFCWKCGEEATLDQKRSALFAQERWLPADAAKRRAKERAEWRAKEEAKEG